jgi:hypothetical protein
MRARAAMAWCSPVLRAARARIVALVALSVLVGAGLASVGSPAWADDVSPTITSPSEANALEGLPFSFTVTTTGSPVPALSIAGRPFGRGSLPALPSGLTFSDNGDGTATIAGTPAPGTSVDSPYVGLITANNGVAPPVLQSLTLTVGVPTAPSLVPNAATAIETVPFALRVQATGDPVPELSATGLPPGLQFADDGDGSGTISGSPLAGSAGTYPVEVTASNGIGDPGSATVVVTVVAPSPPTITSPATVLSGEGAPFSSTITAVGSPIPSIALSGPLPDGVAFTDNGDGTASLSGTPAAGSAGVYPVTITAANGIAPDAQQAFTLTVAPVIVFTSAQEVPLLVNHPFTYTVTTTGSVTSISADDGSGGPLPPGLSFTDNHDGTGVLTGTAPSSPQDFSLGFTAQNTYFTQQSYVAFRVNPAQLSYLGPSTYKYAVGVHTDISLGSDSHSDVVETESGALPDGVTLSDGLLTGTPSAGTEGTYPIVLHFSNGLSAAVTASFSLVVGDPEPAAFTSPLDVTAQVGQPLDFDITASGTPTPVIQAVPEFINLGIRGGGPPIPIPGLTLTMTGYNNSSWKLSGTPLPGTEGRYQMSWLLSTFNGVSSTSNPFTITILPAAPSCNGLQQCQSGSSSSPSGTASAATDGGQVSASATGSGGVTVGTYPGDPAGAPSFTSTGRYFDVAVSSVNSFGSLQIQDCDLNGGNVVEWWNPTSQAWAPVSNQVLTSGPPACVTVTVDASSTPSLAQLTGTVLAIARVSHAPAFTSPASGLAVVGVPFSFTVATSGFPLASITVASGRFPSKVSLHDNGNGTATISGTAATGTTGTYTVQLSAKNGVKPNASQTFTLTVDQRPAITSAASTTATAGKIFAFKVTATGVPIPSITASGLPAGVVIVDSGKGSAALGGKLTRAGTYTFTITAHNGIAPDATQTFTLKVR